MGFHLRGEETSRGGVGGGTGQGGRRTPDGKDATRREDDNAIRHLGPEHSKPEC
jgi:hypothetical protein